MDHWKIVFWLAKEMHIEDELREEPSESDEAVSGQPQTATADPPTAADRWPSATGHALRVSTFGHRPRLPTFGHRPRLPLSTFGHRPYEFLRI